MATAQELQQQVLAQYLRLLAFLIQERYLILNAALSGRTRGTRAPLRLNPKKETRNIFFLEQVLHYAHQVEAARDATGV